jgi:hypothetical protein
MFISHSHKRGFWTLKEFKIFVPLRKLRLIFFGTDIFCQTIVSHKTEMCVIKVRQGHVKFLSICVAAESHECGFREFERLHQRDHRQGPSIRAPAVPGA